jgi:methyl-accepting chemotaxis protein
MFVLVCCIGVGMVLLVVWMVRRAVRSQVQPLRRTTEEIVASGDRGLRVGLGSRRGDIAALAAAIDSMLDTMAEQDAGLRSEQAARERSLRAASAQQHLAEQQVRRRAQGIVDETSGVLIDELQTVVDQVEAVRVASGTIDERVRAADAVTRDVVAMAHRADEVVGALGASLHRVGGIANLISGVAAKTNLLALNATIEAARAGEAGRSFSIVAREVKELANATARSTEEITSTIKFLERDASVITGALTGMASGIGGIDDATTAVSAVSTQQQAMVAELDRCVKDTIGRLENMADFADRLDRRAAARVAVHGNASIFVGGRSFQAMLVDISETGLRCRVDPEVPLGPDQRAEFVIPLGGDELRLHAAVVRRTESAGRDDDVVEVGVRFIEPTGHISATIRDHVRSFVEATDRTGPNGGGESV